ncbi:MAG TPA: regulatory protein RecX [Bryobacteraceae bacterium]|nr:regulatory protein RecX [Bryobacteraceae bacterium]
MSAARQAKAMSSEALWEYALRCLDRKPYSAAELQRKLRLKADTTATLRAVVEKLREYGLLNDQKFAESFTTSRLEGQGHGAGRVIRDLRTRGIPGQTAESTVRQIYQEVDEQELIRRYLERKFRSKNLPQFLREEKNLASAYRRLRTAGFSSNNSIRVLKEFSQRAEELEDTEDVEES